MFVMVLINIENNLKPVLKEALHHKIKTLFKLHKGTYFFV